MNDADSPILSLTMLGAGQEVGRSCCVIKYRGKTVVCDAGVHPAHSGLASLPFVDELDWSTVDAILVTHFHLDHAASLTYVMEKTNFKDGKGKVYMTHPTKAVYKYIMQDFVRMSSGSESLYTPLDVSLSLSHITPISVHQLISPTPGLSFTPYHAGHVLGACMFLIDIAGLQILYTGDYSREEDRHLVRAELPPIRPDLLIVESTYGVQGHEARESREARFTSSVHTIVKRGGHVLLPVFALGRAQELLLILDEFWAAHPDLHGVPVYYASNLARKCMAVYQTYIHTMNSHIRSRFARKDNPFVFKHISHLPATRGWERKVAEAGPCVILASPGFMSSGPSRELLELWAPDARNGVIITGYSIEGTMARDIILEPDEIKPYRSDGPDGNKMIPRRLSVEYISFSAHVDGPQNTEFIEAVGARHVILVHGEQTAMGRLRGSLQARYKDRDEDVKIHTPKNLETLKLSFRGERVAKAIGSLATPLPTVGSTISGLLISKDYSYTLLSTKDLRDFTGLSLSTVTQKQRVPLTVGWALVRYHLEGMFGSVKEGQDEEGLSVLRVMNAVDVKLASEQELVLEWISGSSSDMIADAAVALVLGIDRSPASVKLTSHPHSHPHSHDTATTDPDKHAAERLQHIVEFLEAHFGDVEFVDPSQQRDIDMTGQTEETRNEVEPELKLEIDDAKLDQMDEETKDVSMTGDDEYQEDSKHNNVPIPMGPHLLVKIDKYEARVSIPSMAVLCNYEPLRRRTNAVLEMAIATIDTLADSYEVTGQNNASTQLAKEDTKEIMMESSA
ncbi:YSH1-component of pre-mRNA polyadenylation factor PF I, related protein [Rhizoctonia solani AG-3 Rhs1AP]|uniref:Endoribonuclease YSH1 n=1 Tax=Rhizoctonia solani AG-3 Rhs1AP TaxID=1086054 RepID=X8J0A7_9AGAM|nr:YSH1-component of pre-mRNA polyadenylation factor PF I, related protein [Rhizoctonia solani AG-3 Rhs1AP]